MIKYSKALSCQDQSSLELLNDALPYELYDILVVEFELVKRSNVVGESQFKANIRVNVVKEDGVQDFLNDFEGKSGTNWNSLKGDVRRSKGGHQQLSQM